MKIVIETDERLVVRNKPGFFSWFLLAWTVLMFFYFVKSYLEIPRNMENVYGALFVAVAVFVSYLLFTERSTFDFNKISQQLIWNRKRFFKKKEGIVSFHNISKVVLENSRSSSSRSSTRIALITDTEKIPLTIYYSGNSKNCRQVAEKIRQFLEYSESDLVLDSIKEMIIEGHDIEAIKLLREEKDLSLTEAKQELDRLKDTIK